MNHGNGRDALSLVADLLISVPLHLAPEACVVGHDESEIADLGPVHPRPVDLVEDPMADGEPDTARDRGGANGVFGATRPRGRDAGAAWRRK